MRIALDCSFLVLNKASGIHTYTSSLVKALAARSTGHDYVGAYFYFRAQGAVPPLPISSAKVRFPRRILEWGWTRWRFPPVDWLIGGVDVYHSVHCIVPPLRKGVSVLTIHDLREFRLPRMYPWLQKFREQRSAWARRADRIIAISECTRRDIIEFMNVDPKRIHVVPNGVDSAYWSGATNDEKLAARRKFGLDRPFVIFLASADPRKGLKDALAAYSFLARQQTCDLVIAGEGPPALRDIGAPGVKITGVLARDSMRALMCEAEALVFPSYYEGFGLPVVEAFACGTPVVAYDGSSIPEVAGGAAMLVPLGDVEALGRALAQVISDHELNGRLVAAGLQRCSEFSWERVAQRVEAVYLEASQTAGH